MKKNLKYFILVIVIFMFTSSQLFAADLSFKELIKLSIAELAVTKDSPELLVLTYAPYININGKSGLTYLQSIQKLTGCSIGEKNLLFFHRIQTAPLSVTLFKKSSQDAIIITFDKGKMVKENINLSIAKIGQKEFWENRKNIQLYHLLSGVKKMPSK